MIGVILSGHGQFASGMNSSLKLLNGTCEELVCIDFHEGTSFEDLCDNLDQIIEELKMEEIIVLTDLPGGSPCKAAALATVKYPHVKAMTGTNFPLLLEIVLGKDYAENAQSLIEKPQENARDALMQIILDL